MEEKDFRDNDNRIDEEILCEMTENTPVPSSLQPEAVQTKLERIKKEKQKKYRKKYIVGAAAACFCLLLAAGGYAGLRLRNEVQSMDTASSEMSVAGQMETPEEIGTARDYNEIYEYISEYQDRLEKSMGDMTVGSAEYAVQDSAAASNSASKSSVDTGSAYGSYSDTNVREEGIGEADIIKTDGNNIYIVNGKNVKIIDISSGSMKEAGSITVDESDYVCEVYVEAGKLAVLYNRADYNDGTDGYDWSYKNFTYMDVYDVSDPDKPQLLGTVSQSGMYNSMRAKDGYIYILSNFQVNAPQARDDTAAYIPEIQGKLLEATDIFMPESRMGNQYTVISAVSLDNPSECTDKKAVFGSSDNCYVSEKNIYVTESCYGENDADVTQTAVRKISYNDGQLLGTAQTKVDGTLNDSFSIDEYDGYLRLVTTVTPMNNDPVPFFRSSDGTEGSEETNSLYILDENLELTGKIEGLAEGETVYSARFMGETAYFVTFKQVDPLFSADLSDPASPKITGELKIPGFSEYLHPYGDDILLGIGMDMDEEGVASEGVKLSMFDISDPADVTEADKYVIEDTYGTEAAYNYKSVFIDTEKNLFGFLVYGDMNEYYVFTYDKSGGFQKVFSKAVNNYGSVRGLYSGDTFYMVTQGTVEAYELSSFEKIDDIVL